MGWENDEILAPAQAANWPPPEIGAGKPWEADPIVATADQLTPAGPRAAEGAIESMQAGLQASVGGLFWRGKVPDLVLDPQHAKWWERALTGISQVGADIVPMALGGAFGAAAGGVAGTAVGPAGTAVGTVLGGGAGMFGIPAMMREILIQGYKSGEIKTAADFWNAIREGAGEVAKSTAKEAAVGAVTFGAGSVAARGIGTAILPAIGESMTVGTGIKVIGATDTAAQIAAMVSMPAALQGRLPDLQEFMDAAIVIGGLKLAHPIAERMTNVYRKTGKTPADQVQDAQANPKVAEELKASAEEDVANIPTFRDQLTKQEELWSIQDQLAELDRRAAGPGGLPIAEVAKRDALRTKVTALEAEGVKPAVPRETLPPAPPPGPRFTPDQLVEAAERAKTRLEALTAKATTEALTDAERAERIGLANAMGNPEALAKRFGIEPALKVPTAKERDASAQRIYDDVYRQLQEANQARTIAGTEPLGDAHAKAVALIISREARQYGEALGRMPEDVYRERYLTIRDDSEGARGTGEPAPAMPPEAPRAPEVDLFGDPITTETINSSVSGVEPQMVKVADLVLSKDVKQFKGAANEKGVVEPLTGTWDPTGVGPVQIWERNNGDMEVISGRHRLDMVQRQTVPEIWAQVHKESEGFTRDQAETLDAILNIRDGQGSVADFAQYFKASGITEELAAAEGLTGRFKGRTGFSIARDGSADLMAAHRAGLLSDDAALVISQTAPGSERLQALGIAMVNDGKSALFAANTMKAVDLMAAERQAAGAQGDIFGFDDSAMREAAAMAKKASSMQRKISEQISAVSGASRRPELARKLGVDVQDPEGVQKKITELKAEQYQWDNWPLYPELVAKLRAKDLNQVMFQTGERAASAKDWQDAPLDEKDYKTWNEISALEHAPYVKDGEVLANSRQVPNDLQFPPVGTWRISEIKGIHGREIEQLVELPIASLKLGELDSRGRLDPTKAGDDARYAEWLKEGKRPPPINVLQQDGGTLSVIDGHRRALAAQLAGKKTIEAWVNYAVPIPDGGRINSDPSKPFIRTGMTYEMLTGEIQNPYLDRMPLSMSFDLKAETPAELKARDEEAAAAAKRKLAQERAGVKGPVPTVDQLDIFNTQRTLFQHVYHGSPHDFKRFSLEKIGTGEGAAAYGWGLYFAENPGIAAGYHERLAGNPQMVEMNLGSMRLNPRNQFDYSRRASENTRENIRASLAEDLMINEMDLRGATDQQAHVLAVLDAKIKDYETEWPEGAAAGKELRKMLALPGAVSVKWEKATGGVYTVDIQDSAVAKMLDWDAPLAKQPDAVKDAVRGLLKSGGYLRENDNGPRVLTSAWKAYVNEHAGMSEGDKGSVIYQAFIDRATNERAAGSGEQEPQKAASLYLNSLGIPGIKYDDAASRDPNVRSKTKNIVAFDENIITITHKDGTPFTQAERNEYFQKPAQEREGQHLGSYNVAERLVTLFEHANKSTVIHEVGHHFLENLKHFASQPDAPQRIKDMWQTARQEFAIGEDGDISTASHEMNARSFERYLGEGVAPSAGLRAVFAQFKAWMLEIYGNLQNLGVNINPEVRDLFDKMLATDQEIADARALDVPRAYVPEARRAAAEKIVPPAPEGRKIEPGFEAEKASMEPYADELPKGPGEAPDSSHINYAYINSPMDVKLAMQRMAEIDQANIQKQRGGTQGVKSWAEANAEQAKYVNDILGGSEDTLRLLSPRGPDAAGPDVKLGILKKLAVGAAKDSARLRDVVLTAGHDATVRQQLEYMGSIERARMIQAEFLGERAGVARALNALKDVTEGTGEIGRMLDAIGYGEAAARELFQTARTPAEEQAYMQAKLNEILQNYKGKSVLDIAKLHKEIGTLKGTFKFSKEVTKATKWEMVVEGWKAGLLSGPVTHTTNLFGTGAFQALRAPVDALAAVIGMARGASPGMGESDRASMSEGVARITGMLGGIQDGVKVAVATFKLDDPTGKTEAYRTAIPGRAGEIIRIPLRLMGAEDALVTTMYMRGELKTLAIRQAFDEQLNPGTREFAERVQHLTDNPTPEIQARAEAAATRMTFNMPLGEKGVALQLFVNKWNLQWMIPFIRTPINIAKELLRMSPFAPAVGEWRAAIAKGGVERDRALAEIALGTGITALTMAYAFAGNISGAGSPDPGKNRGKAGVWQPYSILIGDTWYEYARIQPTGTLMGMAADIANVWDHMTEEEKDKVPKMLAAAFAQAITNQTFLQGITNFVNAMSDPARFGPRFLQQMAGSLVPNVIGQPTTMADPVVREVNGMIEAIQARIPGMRQELLPKRDWLGEPVETKERVGVILPSRTLKVSEDKVRLEAARLDISMAAAPKKTHIGKGTGKMGDVPLTPEERNTFAKVGGEMAHQVLTNVVNAPGYDEMPDLVRRKVFAKVLQASHQVAAVAALPPDKRVAYITSISEKMATALEPEAQ